MYHLFSSENPSAVGAAGGRLGDVGRHRVLMPAEASPGERRRAMIGNLVGRFEAAVYAVVSFGLIAVAAICLIAPLVVGAAVVIGVAA